MITIRKVVDKEYETIHDFVRNEKFNLQFNFVDNGMLKVTILYCDPITKGMSEIHNFLFSQTKYLENYEEEQKFKDDISSNPELFFK